MKLIHNLNFKNQRNGQYILYAKNAIITEIEPTINKLNLNLLPICREFINSNKTMINMANILIDQFNRKIDYIRVSVTDRCDFRCIYCMSEKMTFLPKENLLSLEEIARIIKIFSNLGVDKVRITGGEPLVRKNIEWLFQTIGQYKSLNEFTLTTK